MFMSLVLGLIVIRVTTEHLSVRNVFAARDVKTVIVFVSLYEDLKLRALQNQFDIDLVQFANTCLQ